MIYLRRYKALLVSGLCIRLLYVLPQRNLSSPATLTLIVLSGVGLMIHSRGANGSTAELVWTQILQGLGGGMAAVASQVGAQASVPHADVAMVTAAVLLVTEIGGAIGSAIGKSLMNNHIWARILINACFSWSNLDQHDAHKPRKIVTYTQCR